MISRSVVAAVLVLCLAACGSAQTQPAEFDPALEAADVISPDAPLAVDPNYVGPSPVTLPIDALEQVQNEESVKNAPDGYVVETREQQVRLGRPRDLRRHAPAASLSARSRRAPCPAAGAPGRVALPHHLPIEQGQPPVRVPDRLQQGDLRGRDAHRHQQVRSGHRRIGFLRSVPSPCRRRLPGPRCITYDSRLGTCRG